MANHPSGAVRRRCNVAEPRRIELGPASGDLTVINSGLAEADRVVTDGQYKLQANARVSIVPTVAQAEAK